MDRSLSWILPFSVALLSCYAAPIGSTVASHDWLIDSHSFTAKVQTSKDGRELLLASGLVRRVIRLQPGAATVAFDNLMTSESLLRSVRPEAIIELNGQKF